MQAAVRTDTSVLWCDQCSQQETRGGGNVTAVEKTDDTALPQK